MELNSLAGYADARFLIARRIKTPLADGIVPKMHLKGVDMIANYIDELIMFCVGAWATAVGFGYVQMPVKDPLARDQWQARFGKMFKWIGPILIVIAVVLAVSRGTGAGGGV